MNIPFFRGVCLVIVCGCALASPSPAPSAQAVEPTAAEIVKRNAAARGGAVAWNKIKAIAWAGHVESSTMPGQDAPFLLEQQRPNHTRFEVMAKNQRSVRIYNGTTGWKLRPGSNGMPQVESYSRDEINYARDAQVIEGPLMDDAARGASISLIGAHVIEGRKNYALEAVLTTGGHHRIWVDAETFLETRYERDFQNSDGRTGVASVRYRDYQDFQGLKMPTVIETIAAGGDVSNKLVIEKIALNPAFDARMFDKPDAPATRHRGVIVDTRSQRGPSR